MRIKTGEFLYMACGSGTLPVFILCNVLPILAAHAVFTSVCYRDPPTERFSALMCSSSFRAALQGLHKVGMSGQSQPGISAAGSAENTY